MFNILTDEQAGKLIKEIFEYEDTFDMKKIDDPVINMAFVSIKSTLDRDQKKYIKICERNRINGLKGGRPNNPDNPVGSLGTQINPENPDEPDSGSVSGNGTGSEEHKKSRNGIPYKEIISYLNKKAATNYKHTSKETQRCIKARLSSLVMKRRC